MTIDERMTELEETIEKLEKELKITTQSYQYYSNKNEELAREIEGLHHVLDNLTPTPPRGTKEEESWKNFTYSVTTRLAIWLGSKK